MNNVRKGASTTVKKRAVDLESLVTVARTMSILELLADSGKGMTLSEIARELDVNKSIALRILSSLETANYVFRGIESQRYLLTYKVCGIGLSVLISNRFMEQIQPRLRHLADESGELVLLSSIQEEGPQWIMAARGGPGRRLQVDPMMRASLHSTATGKAWLATLPDEEVERRVGRELLAITPRTISSLTDLLAELAVIRVQGFSIADQENEEGIKAISLPIRREKNGEKQECVGFVSITAPISRASDDDFASFRAMLQEASLYFGDIWRPRDEAHLGARHQSDFRILD